MTSIGPGGSDIDKARRGGYVSRQRAQNLAAARMAAWNRDIPPTVQHEAVTIADAVAAYYNSIPVEVRARLLRDWSESRHWREQPGICIHCDNPAPTNLVNEQKQYAHKMCTEVSDYLAEQGAS